MVVAAAAAPGAVSPVAVRPTPDVPVMVSFSLVIRNPICLPGSVAGPVAHRYSGVTAVSASPFPLSDAAVARLFLPRAPPANKEKVLLADRKPKARAAVPRPPFSPLGEAVPPKKK